MTKLFSIAGLACVVLFAAGATAQAGGNLDKVSGLTRISARPGLADLACLVGANSEVMIANLGGAPIAAGATIEWNVNSAGLEGRIGLDRGLGVGGRIAAGGDIAGAGQGLPCTATLL
jgi:hypothetical protein